MSINYPIFNNTKQYITLFKYRLDLSNLYKIKILDHNKLSVEVIINHNNYINDSFINKKLNIILYFNDNDDVISIIDTNNLEFYNSYLYNEIILPRKDNEVWNIIKNKYHVNNWIEKYIFFLLNAPKTIEYFYE